MNSNKIRVMAMAYAMNDGGAERVILNNLYAFKNDEIIDFRLFVYQYDFNSNISKEIKKNGLCVTYLTTKKEYNYQKKLGKEERNRIEQETWSRTIRDYKPDIVHVHISPLLLNTLSPIMKNKVPLRFNTLHSDPSRFKGELLATIRRAYKEGGFVPICLNEEQQKKAKKLYGFKQSEILHNGINYKKILAEKRNKNDARKELGIPMDCFLIAGVGRVAPVKKYPLMIKVFGKIKKERKDATLIIAGSCSLKNRIILSAIGAWKGILSDIVFLGNVENTTVVYCAADLLLMTSQSEASPLTLIEAQFCGVKCIVSPGVPTESIVTDLVKKVENADNLNEWLIAYKNPNAYKIMGDYHFDDYDAEIQSERLKEIYINHWRKSSCHISLSQ